MDRASACIGCWTVPSLAPNDPRLVDKKLAEPGDVDDQAAWLDDRTVTYAKLDESNGQLNVSSVPADGSGAPTLLAEDAESPIPLR